ncbi:Non-reducing end beta-L-arabinofuranosidase [Paenibacillus sp. P1XP2]|nr:Non-reducing end beta-L-arabinofuranosidase [Paenibacillus sp. P1XP2]
MHQSETTETARNARLSNYKIEDPFWSYYIDLVRNVVVPYQWEALNDRVNSAEPSGAVANFKIAAGLMEGEFYGMVFQDSDVAKWLEAAAYLLETRRIRSWSSLRTA